MSKSVRKALILTFKCGLAAALLAWVLSGVNWNDFVVDADGGQRVSIDSATPVEGGLQLQLPDRTVKVRTFESLQPIDPDVGTDLANYVRPGFFSAVTGIRYLLLAAGMAGSLLSMLLMAYRWWRLVEVQGDSVSFPVAMRLSWIGAFFNFIVLGTTGGDLVKAFYLARYIPGKTVCLVTVIADRLMGLMGLVVLAAVMMTTVHFGRAHFDPTGNNVVHLRQALIGMGILIVVLLAVGLFLFSAGLRQRLGLEALYQRLPLSRHLARAGRAIERYRANPLVLVRAMLHSFAVHLVFIGGIGLLGASLGMGIPWFGYLIFIPLIYIIAAVPIVPGGVGLAESLYVAFFVAWAGESEILALALLARLTPMFWSMPGLAFALTEGKPPMPVTEEPEDA